jgi:hypothetical protein
MGDFFDDFMEYDFVFGADVVTCPHCGTNVHCSLLFDDEIECSQCGKKFKRGDKKRKSNNAI